MFTGKAEIALKMPIDDGEPLRVLATITDANEIGVTAVLDYEEGSRTFFIPFSNIRCIEKAEEQPQS